jgi:hypothetical protein
MKDVARQILAELAPEELPYFEVVADDFYGDTRGRRRAVDALLSGRRSDDPVGFDAAVGIGMMTTLILTILNGVATDVLKETATGWWQKRRQRKRLAQQVRPSAELPKLNSVDAAEVGRLAYQLAIDSKVEPERAQRVANLIAAALTGPAL